MGDWHELEGVGIRKSIWRGKTNVLVVQKGRKVRLFEDFFVECLTHSNMLYVDHLASNYVASSLATYSRNIGGVKDAKIWNLWFCILQGIFFSSPVVNFREWRLYSTIVAAVTPKVWIGKVGIRNRAKSRVEPKHLAVTEFRIASNFSAFFVEKKNGAAKNIIATFDTTFFWLPIFATAFFLKRALSEVVLVVECRKPQTPTYTNASPPTINPYSPRRVMKTHNFGCGNGMKRFLTRFNLLRPSPPKTTSTSPSVCPTGLLVLTEQFFSGDFGTRSDFSVVLDLQFMPILTH